MANDKWKFPRRTVLVDFDGTLGTFSWPDLPERPFPGAAEAIRTLKENGFTILIFTTRVWPGWEEIDGAKFRQQKITEMRLWLARWSIPYDGVTCEKVPCMFIIDDRCLNPTMHSWDQILEIVLKAASSDTYGTSRRSDDAEKP